MANLITGSMRQGEQEAALAGMLCWINRAIPESSKGRDVIVSSRVFGCATSPTVSTSSRRRNTRRRRHWPSHPTTRGARSATSLWAVQLAPEFAAVRYTTTIRFFKELTILLRVSINFACQEQRFCQKFTILMAGFGVSYLRKQKNTQPLRCVFIEIQNQNKIAER